MVKNKVYKGMLFVLVLILLTSSIVFAAHIRSDDVVKGIVSKNIMNHIEFLSEDIGERQAGTAEEKEASDYIDSEFKSYGLVTAIQNFDAIVFECNAVSLSEIDGREYINKRDMQIVEFSGSGNLNTEVIYANLGKDEDFQALENAGKSIEGKIALIKRGELYFYEKVDNAIKYGAVGVILFNRDDEEGFINATLSSERSIPVVEILPELGRELATDLVSMTIRFEMIADTEVHVKPSQNVIATKPATRQKSDTPTIVIGAHYDGVDTPAANDNASGTATMLEVARVLSGYDLNANIKFIAFGAEEVGLVGSYHFVENLTKQELKGIAGMINLDMVGVGNTVGLNTLENKKKGLADFAASYARKYKLPYEYDITDRSDHAPFAEAGVLSVYLDYREDFNYHTPADSYDKIIEDNVYNICRIVTAMTYDLTYKSVPKSDEAFKSRVGNYKFNPNKNRE